MKRILLSAVAAIFLAPPAITQVYKLAEMNTEQIRKLDRTKTAVLIPGGILEEHGPYLPGTYAVRFSTLRAIFMDLATELGEQGFRWVFIIPMILYRASGVGCAPYPRRNRRSHYESGAFTRRRIFSNLSKSQNFFVNDAIIKRLESAKTGGKPS